MHKTKEKLSIFVSSNDTYADCWHPFFTLLNKNWPACNLPIILNTESKDYFHKNLDIQCPKIGKNHNGRIKWGKRFIESLKYVKTKYVLLMLDDYFIYEPVKVNKIFELLELMEEDDISNIQLAERDDVVNHPTKHNTLNEVDQYAKYRFNFQVSIWKTAKLFTYLRAHESPWEHEYWGTKRAWLLQDKIYCINKTFIKENGVPITYPPPGAIKRGKWDKSMVINIQKSNNITIDTSQRGFFNGGIKKTIIQKIKNRISKLPNNIISLSDYYILKIKVTAKGNLNVL